MSTREMNGKNDSSTGTRDFVIGAIVGAVAGAAAAVLLTPRSGRELRSTISEQTVSAFEKTDVVKTKAMKKSSELASAAREKANNLVSSVTQHSPELLKRGKERQEDIHNAEEDVGSPLYSQGHSSEEIQRKLEETQKAFDDTEQKLNH